MTACSYPSYYPTPEPSLHKIYFLVADSVEEVREKRKLGNKIQACAWARDKNVCVIAISKDNWERWTVHEVGHCLKVNNHK